MEDQTLYNQITVKNIDNEDFVFKVSREQYMIEAGEVRVFPKFMVRPMLKHLIDKILIKRNPEGKLLRNRKLREELAAKIVLKEETYQKPIVPTDKELVERMNTQPELDRVLEKNKKRQRKKEVKLIDKPKVVPTEIPSVDKPLVKPKVKARPKTKTKVKKAEIVVKKSKAIVPTTTETFDQIEDEKKQVVPSRDEMLKYAKNVLRLDINEPKTKKAWDKMSDKKLFVELGLDKEEDLKELGIK